jgi:hypothetical protein
MALSALSLVLGGTLSNTGGTADAVESVSNLDRALVTFTDDSLELQRTLNIRVVPAKVNTSAPNGYTQARRELYFKFPLSLDNGNMTNSTVTLNVSSDIELEDSEMSQIRETVGQVLISSAMDGVFNKLSVA